LIVLVVANRVAEKALPVRVAPINLVALTSTAAMSLNVLSPVEVVTLPARSAVIVPAANPPACF
jgi:hypothetical protein